MPSSSKKDLLGTMAVNPDEEHYLFVFRRSAIWEHPVMCKRILTLFLRLHILNSDAVYLAECRDVVQVLRSRAGLRSGTEGNHDRPGEEGRLRKLHQVPWA